MDKNANWIITRRTFLKSSLTSLAVLPLSCALNSGSRDKKGTARFGIVTDCHYADADTQGVRFYRESLDKFSECVTLMNVEKVEFLIELGDFMRKVKGRSSHKVQLEISALKKRYWGRYFWGRGYFSTTSGAITDDVILQYLENHIDNPADASR